MPNKLRAKKINNPPSTKFIAGVVLSARNVDNNRERAEAKYNDNGRTVHCRKSNGPIMLLFGLL